MIITAKTCHFEDNGRQKFSCKLFLIIFYSKKIIKINKLHNFCRIASMSETFFLVTKKGVRAILLSEAEILPNFNLPHSVNHSPNKCTKYIKFLLYLKITEISQKNFIAQIFRYLTCFLYFNPFVQF